MIKIEYNGKTYMYDGKNFIDDTFIILEGEELRNVSRVYFSSIEYQTLGTETLLTVIKQMKTIGLYYEAKKAIDFAVTTKSQNLQLLHDLMPIYMSCCRAINQPQDAIKFAEEFLPICGGSVPTYTSLAAAYCDVQNYEKAKRYAKLAYAKQGGGKGYTTELSLVFKRLVKETGEDFSEGESK